MLLSIGFPDEKQLIGAYHKSRRDERPQTGVLTPGNCTMVKKVLKGRQRHKQVVIKQVRYSVAPSGRVFKITFLCETKKRLYFSIYIIDF